MDRLIPGTIVIVLLLGIITIMILGWRGRVKRQAQFEVPAADAAGSTLASSTGLYVATTLANAPLERVTVSGLAFRGRAVVTVSTGGVEVAVNGEKPVFVNTGSIRSVGTSTWTIDRVVESGGMLRLDWTLTKAGEPVDVETYFRPETPADRDRLLEAVSALAPNTDDTTADTTLTLNPDTKHNTEGSLQ
jgi:hypothetical protein